MAERLIHPAELERELSARLGARPHLRLSLQARRFRRVVRVAKTFGMSGALIVGTLMSTTALWASGTPVDLTTLNASVPVNGAILTQSNFDGSTGTGVFDSFVRFQANGTEEGYNTSGRDVQYDELTSHFTRDLPLNQVPLVNSGGTLYREFRFDINEVAGGESALLSLDRIRMFLSPTASINVADPDSATFGQSDGTFLAWDLDGGADRYVKLNYDLAPGSGNGDMVLLVPNSAFGSAGTTCQYNGFDGASCGYYVYLYSKAGEEFSSSDGFEEWSVRKAAYLSVTKTATSTFTRTFPWTIDKTVTPATWNMFTGDTGTSRYTVSLTKGTPVDSAWAVSGSITVSNPSTETASVTSVTDVISGAGAPAVTPSCPVTFPYSLAAGGSFTCTYSAALPDGTSRTNTATAALADGGSFTGTAAITFGSPTTVVNGTVHVTDTYAGSLGAFSATGSTTYDRTFTCDADEGTHNNTATITETAQSDSAAVTVNCFALGVTKDAATAFTRTYSWTIDKSSTDPTTLLLNPGETYVYPYRVTVNATYADSAWGATGNIHVNNPAPVAATLTSVSDAVSGVGAASVTCGVTFPYTLAAGATLNCTYSIALPDATSRTNTATATLQNHSFSYLNVPTNTGTTNFTGTANVTFAGATITSVDECIAVTDTLQGSLGNWCYADGVPHTFTYNRTIGPYTAEQCGHHDINNTASFTTNDTAATGSDAWSVGVDVPCNNGCTLTQGYWKTHSAYGPAPEDDTWDLLANGADTLFFGTQKTWFQIFWTAPKGGNAYYILAHQYEAAVLNQLAGASSTADVDAALAWAETFFNTYQPTSQLSKAVRADAIYYAGILGSYNQGDIGPGHCSEDSISRSAPA